MTLKNANHLQMVAPLFYLPFFQRDKTPQSTPGKRVYAKSVSRVRISVTPLDFPDSMGVAEDGKADVKRRKKTHFVAN